MKNTELHAIFRGRVQGVGFRWTVVDCAEQFHLTGFTKNLADGTVEVYAQGSKESLDAFLAAVERESGSARIDSVKTEYQQPAQAYQDFTIVY